MREFKRYWRVRGVRKELFVRAWWWGNPVRSFVRWLLGKPAGWGLLGTPPAEAELRTCHAQNRTCYCRAGCVTEFRLTLFGVGFWGHVSRDPTPRPCDCDKVVWCLYPSEHADEIEAYGEAKLRAEFPDVRSIEGWTLPEVARG